MSINDGFVEQFYDPDPAETREWLESLDAVTAQHGAGRGQSSEPSQ